MISKYDEAMMETVALKYGLELDGFQEGGGTSPGVWVLNDHETGIPLTVPETEDDFDLAVGLALASAKERRLAGRAGMEPEAGDWVVNCAL